MSKNPQIVSHAQVISVFGTSFWVPSDSAADYILHPIFLRFTILCIGIYALLDQSDPSRQLIGWQMPVIWLAMSLAVIAGYVLVGGWFLQLFRKGIIRRLYMPFLLLPIVVIAETTEQVVVVVLQAGGWQPLPTVLTTVTRDFLVIMLMDTMHVQFVAPLHPLARMEAPEETVQKRSPTMIDRWEAEETPRPRKAQDEVAQAQRTEPPEGPARETATDGGATDLGMVRIADRVFDIGDIQSVRTEDHYLNVVTRSARSMVRAKLSDVAALHDGRYGVQINRSQWVAFAAIETVKDEPNGQLALTLVNGDSATVSRTRRLMFTQLFNTQRGRNS